MLIGIGSAALVVRLLSNAGVISPRQAGFRGGGRTLLAVVAGAALGFIFYAGQGAPTFNPNTVALVVLLTVVGLVTSLFYFVSREVYGTIVFHNFAAIFGVTRRCSRQRVGELRAAGDPATGHGGGDRRLAGRRARTVD
jgi:hypothetical protein